MEIRKAKEKDFSAVCKLLQMGRENIKSLGIDQWQNGAPSERDLENDIKNGTLYVADEGGKILGMCFIGFYESDYDYIYWGNWESGEYAVMHRVAVDTESRGKGVFSALIGKASELAIQEGKTQLRIDTHRGNTNMQKALLKGGFVRMGVIYLKNGDERVAFLKKLDKII